MPHLSTPDTSLGMTVDHPTGNDMATIQLLIGAGESWRQDLPQPASPLTQSWTPEPQRSIGC